MCICDKLCPAVRRGIEIEFCQQNYEIEKVTEVYPSQTVDKVLRETEVSRSIFLCVYEIYSENRKFSLGLCHP